MSVPMTAMIEITDAEKTFTMHLQGGVELPVVRGVSFQVKSGMPVTFWRSRPGVPPLGE